MIELPLCVIFFYKYSPFVFLLAAIVHYNYRMCVACVSSFLFSLVHFSLSCYLDCVVLFFFSTVCSQSYVFFCGYGTRKPFHAMKSKADGMFSSVCVSFFLLFCSLWNAIFKHWKIIFVCVNFLNILLNYSFYEWDLSNKKLSIAT